MFKTFQYGSSYGSSSPSASTTTILGRLPDYVISTFQSNYGRYNQVFIQHYGCRFFDRSDRTSEIECGFINTAVPLQSLAAKSQLSPFIMGRSVIQKF